MTKLFVSNFDSHTSLASLAGLFERHGDVAAVRIRQGQKRVYAIVEMPSDSAAADAIRGLDGEDWQGMRLEVTESRF